VTESINLHLLLSVCSTVWMGSVKLLLGTRELSYYSKLVLGPQVDPAHGKDKSVFRTVNSSF